MENSGNLIIILFTILQARIRGSLIWVRCLGRDIHTLDDDFMTSQNSCKRDGLVQEHLPTVQTYSTSAETIWHQCHIRRADISGHVWAHHAIHEALKAGKKYSISISQSDYKKIKNFILIERMHRPEFHIYNNACEEKDNPWWMDLWLI